MKNHGKKSLPEECILGLFSKARTQYLSFKEATRCWFGGIIAAQFATIRTNYYYFLNEKYLHFTLKKKTSTTSREGMNPTKQSFRASLELI